MNSDIQRDLEALRESIRKMTRLPLFLIVEDDAEDAEMMAGELAKFIKGSKITHLPTGERALKFLESVKVDAIFLDLKLPGISGLDTMRRIREISDAFLIIVTGLPEQSVPTLEAIKLGAVKIIAKPVTQKDLTETFGAL